MKNKYLYTTMGCKRLDTDLGNFLEIVYSEKRGYAEKKCVNYYPFGLEHKGYNFVINGQHYPYGYNGKEENDELGLEWLDFGARNYDASLGRWMNIDLLADIAYDRTPYHYVSNNPINRIDPDGLTDFAFDKESGEVTQVGDANDDPDRIVKTRKDGSIKRKGEGFLGFLVRDSEKGKAKVAIDNVEKGILKDGQNFKTEGALIDVGQGLDSPGEAGVFKFMMDLSEYVGVEMGATLYSNIERTLLGETTHMGITPYGVEGREHTDHSSSTQFNINSLWQEINVFNYREVGRAHTHPSGDQYKTYQPSKADIENKDIRLDGNPGLRHLLIFRPKASKSPFAFKTMNYNNSTLKEYNYD